MKGRKADLLQGTPDLLVLKALALGPLHGLGVSRRIEQMTRGTFQVKPGSLFPALHRMEDAAGSNLPGENQKMIVALSTTASPEQGDADLKPRPSPGSGSPWPSRMPSRRHTEDEP